MPRLALIHTAITAAIEAGKIILEIYNSDEFGIETKKDNSPLTKADLASHKVILSYLEKTGIPVLSEEGKEIPYAVRKDWKQLWIVDPIDGTKEFIKRNGEFTVNIALIENQKPVLGVIFVPVSGELYFSSSTSSSTSTSISSSSSISPLSPGAYKCKVDLNNYEIEALLKNGTALPEERADKTYTVVASRSHRSQETEDYINDLRNKHGEVNLISKGSSLKLCMVAEGLADCYPRFAPTMEWDTAAGQAICEHAGFKVIDWSTKEIMLYNREELLNNWFLVK